MTINSIICHILRNQQHHTLTDIATSILKQLGQSILHSKIKIVEITILLVSTVARIYKLVGCSDWYGYTHANVITTLY